MGEFTIETWSRGFGGKDSRPRGVGNFTTGLASDEQGGSTTTITGVDGQVINLRKTYSASVSTGKQAEKQRTYDQMRIYDPNNRDNFIDVEAVVGLALQLANGIVAVQNYARQQESENVEILSRNNVRDNPNQPTVREATRNS